VDATGLELLDSRLGVAGRRDVPGHELDLPAVHPAVGIDEVARDLNAGIFLAGERRLGTAERKDGAHPDRGAGGRGRATGGATEHRESQEDRERAHGPNSS